MPPQKGLNKKLLFFLRLKRKILGHVWLARALLVLGVLLGFYLASTLVGAASERIGLGNISRITTSFIFTPETRVRSFNGRTNILILGKGGEGHAGADLTDTIIFASFSHTDGGLTLVSVPRDIWVPEIRAKLNTAYFWGKQKQEWGGLNLTKSLVEEILGQPVHYGIVLDFNGFKKVIDVLGGIDVEVERGFVDREYPIEGKENDKCNGDSEFKCRYETVTFEKGKQYMDGATALKFVRSRNAEGEEGTDLARAARQQKVITAVKDQILSPRIFLSPGKLISIWKVGKASLETDLDSSSGAVLARKVLKSKGKSNSVVLPKEFFENPSSSEKYDYQFVFLPRKEILPDGSFDWSEIRDWAKNLLK